MAKRRSAPAPIEDPDPEILGPAMRDLEPKQRRFVIAYCRDASDHSRCAEAAGYSTKANGHRTAAFRMLKNPRVIDAIKEEAGRTLNSAAFIAVSALHDIAANPEHKDRYKAAATILSRTGFPETTQQDVVVNHEDRRWTEMPTAELIDIMVRYARTNCPQVIRKTLNGTEDVDMEGMKAWFAARTIDGFASEGNVPLFEHQVGVTTESDFEKTQERIYGRG
jgi:phage terminase small subunit